MAALGTTAEAGADGVGWLRGHPTTAGPAPPTVVVTLPAEIDVDNRGQVHDTLARALGDGAAVLVADATGTTFCDCAGVSALRRVHQQAAVAGAQFRIAASPAIRRIVKLTGTNHLFSTYPTVAAALDSAQRLADRTGDRNRNHQVTLG